MSARVGIGIPLVALRAKSLVSLCQNLIQTHAEMALLIVEGAYIQHNRALLVKHAREQGCTHLFFMDHDMVFPADTVDRLLAHDKDIVACAYNMRGRFPLESVVTLHDAAGQRVPDADLPGELFRCSSLGCGVMLIKIPVFERIAQPWFHLHIEGFDLLSTEDVWFCNQARQAGIDIWCDPTIPVQHQGEFLF